MIFLFSLSTGATGQLHTEIREGKEIGKEFQFENSKDGVLHSLDCTFMGVVGTDLIKAKFVYMTEDLRTDSSDTLSFDLYCSWVTDIVDVGSTGYEYNAKVCSAIRIEKDYIFELNEIQSEYSSVNLTLFDRCR